MYLQYRFNATSHSNSSTRGTSSEYHTTHSIQIVNCSQKRVRVHAQFECYRVHTQRNSSQHPYVATQIDIRKRTSWTAATITGQSSGVLLMEYYFILELYPDKIYLKQSCLPCFPQSTMATLQKLRTKLSFNFCQFCVQLDSNKFGRLL